MLWIPLVIVAQVPSLDAASGQLTFGPLDWETRTRLADLSDGEVQHLLRLWLGDRVPQDLPSMLGQVRIVGPDCGSRSCVPTSIPASAG